MFKIVRPARPQLLSSAERTWKVREHGEGARTLLATIFSIAVIY